MRTTRERTFTSRRTIVPPRLFWYSMNLFACSRSSSDIFLKNSWWPRRTRLCTSVESRRSSIVDSYLSMLHRIDRNGVTMPCRHNWHTVPDWSVDWLNLRYLRDSCIERDCLEVDSEQPEPFVDRFDRFGLGLEVHSFSPFVTIEISIDRAIERRWIDTICNEQSLLLQNKSTKWLKQQGRVSMFIYIEGGRRERKGKWRKRERWANVFFFSSLPVWSLYDGWMVVVAARDRRRLPPVWLRVYSSQLVTRTQNERARKSSRE